MTLDRAPSAVSKPAGLVEIRRYVQEGGGLAMIGGDLSFSLGGYAHTPVSDILPVEIPEGDEPPGSVPHYSETGRPLRLLEIGASAGLNLRFDRYRYEQDDEAWGPRDSPRGF